MLLLCSANLSTHELCDDENQFQLAPLNWISNTHDDQAFERICRNVESESKLTKEGKIDSSSEESSSSSSEEKLSHADSSNNGKSESLLEQIKAKAAKKRIDRKKARKSLLIHISRE